MVRVDRSQRNDAAVVLLDLAEYLIPLEDRDLPETQWTGFNLVARDELLDGLQEIEGDAVCPAKKFNSLARAKIHAVNPSSTTIARPLS